MQRCPLSWSDEYAINCDQKIYLVDPSHMLIINSNNFWLISTYFSQFYLIFCRHLFFQFQKIWTINYHWFIIIALCYYNFFIYKWTCAKLLHVFGTRKWWIILAHSILHIYSHLSSIAKDYNLWSNYRKWKVHFFHRFFLLISVLLRPKVFNIAGSNSVVEPWYIMKLNIWSKSANIFIKISIFTYCFTFNDSSKDTICSSTLRFFSIDKLSNRSLLDDKTMNKSR